MTTIATIAALYRWPVKGLSAVALDEAAIEKDRPLAHDRTWAIERAGPVFDAAHPRHVPKGKFLQLVNTAQLAALDIRHDAATDTLTLLRGGEVVAEGRLGSPEGRAAIERFLADFLGDAAPARPRIVGAHRFHDVPKPFLSLINLATVRAISDLVGKEVNPLRFRANITIDGLPAWAEFDWVGRTLAVDGEPLFMAEERIGRCIATGVDPDTGERDLHIPRTLLDAFGHKDCGLYLRPVADGSLRPGMTIEAGQAP